ncbi:MAG TPA: hypothetical protein VGJ87_08835 [Roseiflexaceae bacterium]|jgi:hypothetical protein
MEPIEAADAHNPGRKVPAQRATVMQALQALRPLSTAGRGSIRVAAGGVSHFDTLMI